MIPVLIREGEECPLCAVQIGKHAHFLTSGGIGNQIFSWSPVVVAGVDSDPTTLGELYGQVVTIVRNPSVPADEIRFVSHSGKELARIVDIGDGSPS